jgi:hypothetical protein
MPGLTLIERSRLLGCLNLLSRAGTPGERDAAIAAANRILQARNLTWGDVIPLSLVPAEHVVAYDWHHDLRRCCDNFERLSQWERQFVQGIMYLTTLSQKQRAVLASIIAKLHTR